MKLASYATVRLANSPKKCFVENRQFGPTFAQNCATLISWFAIWIFLRRFSMTWSSLGTQKQSYSFFQKHLLFGKTGNLRPIWSKNMESYGSWMAGWMILEHVTIMKQKRWTKVKIVKEIKDVKRQFRPSWLQIFSWFFVNIFWNV